MTSEMPLTILVPKSVDVLNQFHYSVDDVRQLVIRISELKVDEVIPVNTEKVEHPYFVTCVGSPISDVRTLPYLSRFEIYKIPMLNFSLETYFVTKSESGFPHHSGLMNPLLEYPDRALMSRLLLTGVTVPMNAVVGKSHISVPAISDFLRELKMGSLHKPDGIIKPFASNLTLEKFITMNSIQGEEDLFRFPPAEPVKTALAYDISREVVHVISSN